MNVSDLRVTSWALFAAALPAGNGFLETTEVGLKCILLLGQAGIAVFTFLYVYKRWKNTGGNYVRRPAFKKKGAKKV